MAITRSQTKQVAAAAAAAAGKSQPRKRAKFRFRGPKSRQKARFKRRRAKSSKPNHASTAIEEEPVDNAELFVPRPKCFGQSSTVPGYPEYKILNMLELYQAYPHDPGSTLCAVHFLDLARKWYKRRHQAAEARRLDIVSLSSEHSAPDFSSLAIPVRHDWQLVTLDEFSETICNSIAAAERRLWDERSRILDLTVNNPICEISAEALECALCPKSYGQDVSSEHVGPEPSSADPLPSVEDNPKDYVDNSRRTSSNDSDITWESVLGVDQCPHHNGRVVLEESGESVWRCDNCSHSEAVDKTWYGTSFAIKQGDDLVPVSVYPGRMALNSRVGRVSIGGLHFIVDNCQPRTMMKLRSTNYSHLYEMGRIQGDLDADLLSQKADSLGIFKPATCSLAPGNECVCD